MTFAAVTETAPGRIEGSWTRLRSLRPADYAWLYRTATAMDAIGRWRFRGAPPDPGSFPEVIWFGVHTQLVVETTEGEPIGLVTSYGVDLRAGTTKVACIFAAEHRRSGWPFEGVVLFLEHLFIHWPLRKIYFEAPAPVADEIGLTAVEGDLVDREACFTEHDLFEGEYVDMVVFALTRARFEARIRDRVDRGGRS